MFAEINPQVEGKGGISFPLRRMPITELKPAPYNPRIPLEPGTPAYRRLERSLQEFSLVQPIVWNDQTGHIVSGHQRVEILKDRGETDIPVLVVSLSTEREKALNVTLNNRQVGSDWDQNALATLMTDLVDLPDFDATLTGFDERDLNDFLFTPDPNFEPEEEEAEQNHVLVTLEVPPEHWTEIQQDLNEIIRRWRVPVHVQLPS
ncbi:ParB-like nuclease domain protein [Polystyrenella longa]|uniref:ParB-like nuclease domain protein n=1 Tax=Polystyrenella longa TaxID=2528007 RepID=A0A518CHG8_9PLAN|nr:ParB N-terminal domain-containing protein [Polystyrenella longa]QDU78614.1 ParB-like nuclease domain protein [Polystyrenella longa]